MKSDLDVIQYSLIQRVRYLEEEVKRVGSASRKGASHSDYSGIAKKFIESVLSSAGLSEKHSSDLMAALSHLELIQ